MSGILDYINPSQLALLGASSSLLQAGGPSRTPVSFGQALGQGIQGGLGGLQQAQQFQQMEQLNKLRMAQAEEMKRKAAAQAQQQEARQRLAADPRFKGLGDVLALDTPAAIERAIPKPAPQQSPFSRLNPKDFTPASLLKFEQTKNFSDLVAAPEPGKAPMTRKVRRDINGVTKEIAQSYINGKWVDEETGAAFSPTSLVKNDINFKEETEFGKKVGAEMGEQYAGLLKADMNAPTTIAKYQRLGSLLGQVNTGKFRGTITDIKAAAKTVGIDLTAIGVTDDVAPAQAARALSNQIALELRNPAGGAGMPGALSDKDREFLLQSIPGLESDPSAIGKMIEYRVKLEQRAQKVARMARDYRKKNGRFDEGFYDELQAWSDKNPLFPAAANAAPSAPAGRVIDFGSLK
jgi:hypothetical protein